MQWQSVLIMDIALTLLLVIVGLIVAVVLAAPILTILKSWFAYWDQRFRFGEKFDFRKRL